MMGVESPMRCCSYSPRTILMKSRQIASI